MSISIEQAFAFLTESFKPEEGASLDNQLATRFETLCKESQRPVHPKSSSAPKTKSKGKGRPAKLWVCDAEGQVRVEDFSSSKDAQEAAKAAADSNQVRWARAFNDKTGKIFIGDGWVHEARMGSQVKNMTLKYWEQLTPPERHKVKETEVPKYKKPGWECKDLSVKEARWQSVGTSRSGGTYDRRNNCQGIPYKHAADFGYYPFAE